MNRLMSQDIFILQSSAFILTFRARRQAAKALDCKSNIREFESHRALHKLRTANWAIL